MNEQPMNREDAERLAHEFLKRPVNRFYDENYTPDNPAMRIIVKDNQEFIDMLYRRGYAEQAEHNEYGWLFRVHVGNMVYQFVESFFMYETVAEVARKLDEFVGLHHCCCAQCKEPLLLSVKYLDEQKQCEKWRGYRSAKAGPYTELFENCPGCGVVLSNETVQEIQDAN